ncbi:mandelate racemase/muconate lactonizing enzyme family protein [Actinopolymorpha sp. B17G11]|uniref:mandelate racemase/muconate lactonizing enzyme family protein n=1 Tax=unclassified Actinopolymorpha TaxID=2627063 RepID=UPI0032D96D17
MKITAVKTAATVGHGMHLWVKVETDEGITGIGECVHGGVQAIALIQQLQAKLVGRDPFQIDAIFEQLRRQNVFNGGFAGALITALTGIELALWDVKGKALGVPIYELMGGKFRDEIKVYADCQVEPGMDFDDIKRVLDDMLARGFTAFKIDLDIFAYGHSGSEVEGFRKDRFNYTAGPWEHERMVRLAEMARELAGKEIDFAADVHTRLDVPSAIRLAKDLEPFHLMWLEEPVPPENVDAMREVKQSTTTPICAGENLYLRHGFRDLIESQAVDIIMPDIPKCGGLSECRKIAHMAEIYYMPFAPHNVSSPIGTMASAHVCATVPNFLALEFHWLERDYWSTIITDKEDIIKNGFIKLPDRPGLGIELDETVGRQYQYPGTTWFE